MVRSFLNPLFPARCVMHKKQQPSLQGLPFDHQSRVGYDLDLVGFSDDLWKCAVSSLSKEGRVKGRLPHFLLEGRVFHLTVTSDYNQETLFLPACSLCGTDQEPSDWLDFGRLPVLNPEIEAEEYRLKVCQPVELHWSASLPNDSTYLRVDTNKKGAEVLLGGSPSDQVLCAIKEELVKRAATVAREWRKDLLCRRCWKERLMKRQEALLASLDRSRHPSYWALHTPIN